MCLWVEDFKALKIRIPCEQVSKRVQEKVFSEGYEWVFWK